MMPLEIRELQINISVDAASKSKAQQTAGDSGSAEGAKPGDDMIKECVEQVMNTLNQKNER